MIKRSKGSTGFQIGPSQVQRSENYHGFLFRLLYDELTHSSILLVLTVLRTEARETPAGGVQIATKFRLGHFKDESEPTVVGKTKISRFDRLLLIKHQ